MVLPANAIQFLVSTAGCTNTLQGFIQISAEFILKSAGLFKICRFSKSLVIPSYIGHYVEGVF